MLYFFPAESDDKENGMKGTIRYMNPSNSMVAVLTEHGAFSLFELLSETLRWATRSVGQAIIRSGATLCGTWRRASVSTSFSRTTMSLWHSSAV
jgi:hypothetical protein